MNRKYEIITLILVLIVIIGALITAEKNGTLSKEKNVFRMENSENEKITEEFIPEDSVVNFELDIPNTSLEVITTQEENIKIECTSYGKSKYIINQNGNNVKIKKKEDFSIFNWNTKSGIVKIFIPSGVVSSYYADMSNGGISISNINVGEIDIDTSNGDISIDNLNIKNKIEIETSNGKINVSNLLANNVEFNSSNGDIKLDNVTGNDISIDTSNGKISINECRGNEIELDTSNAKIEAYECYGKEVTLNTSNENIILENLKDKEFIIDELEVNTSNGEESINANYNHKK